MYEWHTVEATCSLRSGTPITDIQNSQNEHHLVLATSQLNIIGFLYLGDIDSYSMHCIKVYAGFSRYVRT